MLEVTTRLEVNLPEKVTTPTDFVSLSQLLVKHRVPALVVAPQFIESAIIERQKVNGSFSIICSVDFARGNLYAMEKLRPLPKVVQAVNGFDILVSPGRTDKESLNELKTIKHFIQSVYGQMTQIRWTIGLSTREIEDVQNVLPHLSKFPVSYIRTDNNLVVPGVDVEVHRASVQVIREFVPTPIKISGNVTFGVIKEMRQDVARFDVNVSQFKQILQPPRPRQESEQVSEDVVEEGTLVRVKRNTE